MYAETFYLGNLDLIQHGRQGTWPIRHDIYIGHQLVEAQSKRASRVSSKPGTIQVAIKLGCQSPGRATKLPLYLKGSITVPVQLCTRTGTPVTDYNFSRLSCSLFHMNISLGVITPRASQR
jgi:hypothetical protein